MVKKEMIEPKVRNVSSSSNDCGVVGVVLGILSVVLASLLSIFIAIPGLIFSIIQHKRQRNKWSLAGIILNVIGLILGIIFSIIMVYFLQEQSLMLAAQGSA